MMELHAFVDLVAHMRDAQKRYFKSRSLAVMNEAISLEKEVDHLVESLLDDKKPSLFVAPDADRASKDAARRKQGYPGSMGPLPCQQQEKT